MELILNLFWLFLAVPAIWVWRRPTPSCADRLIRFGPLRCLLVLSCTLLLLFPVVSATDDLHAMRPEMEESSPSKRVARLSGAAKSQARLISGVPAQADTAHFASLCFQDHDCGSVPPEPDMLRFEIHSAARTGRAPPLPTLS